MLNNQVEQPVHKSCDEFTSASSTKSDKTCKQSFDNACFSIIFVFIVNKYVSCVIIFDMSLMLLVYFFHYLCLVRIYFNVRFSLSVPRVSQNSPVLELSILFLAVRFISREVIVAHSVAVSTCD
jgi:hypothetical protein